MAVTVFIHVTDMLICRSKIYFLLLSLLKMLYCLMNCGNWQTVFFQDYRSTESEEHNLFQS